MATSIQKVIDNYILEEIFSDYPDEVEGKSPFDFFMEADVDATVDVEWSPLSTVWGYEINNSYSLDNIRNIRGLMQSMSNDLEKLKTALLQQAVKSTIVAKDNFRNADDFNEFVQSSNATLHREGTADEYATVLTINAKEVF